MTPADTRASEELAADPHAFDTELARRYDRYERITAALAGVRNSIHRAAGDRQDWHGRVQLWRRTDAEVLRDVTFARDHPEHVTEDQRRTAGRLLKAYNQLGGEQADALLGIREMDAIYARPDNRWQRFFPCTNADGHIHASYRDCPTVSWTTAMAWRPDLSGLTVDQAVRMPPEGLGPALCSVCFPAAPVEQRSMTTGQVEQERTRAERDAAKAARELARAAKQLAEDEQFRTTGFLAETVTTVAACKDLIRKAVEQHIEALYYATPEAAARWQGDADQLARVRANIVARSLELDADAERAARVLMAREREHPGWGADAAAIAKIRASKDKSARREWGLR